ncbi:RNA recognition motif containing protein [Nitzschia inconspicua]|uniref:RNA recognition motif containing protein n=1 Tax=Nitzschia inconspicua TaxID=303405 RepID=A0A9K3KAY5_9STRA|nr:RNA recognition motif containing protein [Nitzschia inconspicua]KAG7362562.1 RNA recognition motif containing protein [Nitzschia inconspicua]
MTTTSISQPHNTLYVSNIDWKVKKPMLKRALHMLMTRHGKVLEVVALRKDGLRGQAFVIFDDVTSATEAMQQENGTLLFGKPLKVQYALEKSDRISKRDGTYVPKAKREKKTNNNSNNNNSNSQSETNVGRENPSTHSEMTATAEGTATTENLVPPPPPPNATTTTTNNNNDQPPSHILFATDLPPECNEMMLAMLFRQYTGFVEVRIPRAGLAFIEFDDEPHATLALQRLNGFQLTTNDALKLTYGKA